MENNTKQAIQSELTVEEVNVYAASCGQVKTHCIHDCILGDCFVSCEN